MRVLYIDAEGEPQDESDCDGPDCETRFPEGFMLLIQADVLECKLFCSRTCMDEWKSRSVG